MVVLLDVLVETILKELILPIIEAMEATCVRLAQLSCVLSWHHQVHRLVG